MRLLPQNKLQLIVQSQLPLSPKPRIPANFLYQHWRACGHTTSQVKEEVQLKINLETNQQLKVTQNHRL